METRLGKTVIFTKLLNKPSMRGPDNPYPQKKKQQKRKILKKKHQLRTSLKPVNNILLLKDRHRGLSLPHDYLISTRFPAGTTAPITQAFSFSLANK